MGEGDSNLTWHPTARQRIAALLLRSLPIRHGKHRLLDRIAAHQPSDVPLWAERRIGTATIRLDASDLVAYHFIQLGSFDPEVTDVLCACAGERPLLWDIGANFGTTTFDFLSRLPAAEVVAIEPQPPLARLLEENLRRLAPGRSVVADFAIGDKHEELDLVVPPGNRGLASLARSECPEGWQRVRVPVKPAESLLSVCGRSPTVIKIDVEGFEKTVIRSLEPVLRSGEVRAIVFEHHGGFGPELREIEEMLQSAGLKSFAIHKNALSTSLRPIRAHDKATDYAAINVALVPSGADSRGFGLARLRSR